MPEALKQEEVDKQQDPAVVKQWDDKSSSEEKFKDFYAIADKLKVCIMSITRSRVGAVGRSMGIAKRSGPDFLFLANAHSQKFDDLKENKATNLYFQNTSNMDWISITGETVTTSSDDPRIKEIWSRGSQPWFGDLGDGVHTGKPDDPRMTLIEVQPKYISYWKADVGFPGLVKEVGGALITGGVATPGTLRQMHEQEIVEARKRDAQISS